MCCFILFHQSGFCILTHLHWVTKLDCEEAALHQQQAKPVWKKVSEKKKSFGLITLLFLQHWHLTKNKGERAFKSDSAHMCPPPPEAERRFAQTAHVANVCRPWLNACRLCALVAEVSPRWQWLFVHLPPWHGVHGAGEGSPGQSGDQPGELPLEQLAVASVPNGVRPASSNSEPPWTEACGNYW